MSYVLSLNNRAGRDNRPPAPALKENGENFKWRMFYDENKRIVDADTVGECLEQLIDGYLLADLEMKDAMRGELARAVQTSARVAIFSEIDPSVLEPWEVDVLTYEPAPDAITPEPVGWGEGEGILGEHKPGVVDVWSSSVPLVLVDTSYTPFTDIARPVSSEGDYRFVKNIIWLEPSNELAFLESLSRIGFISFGTPRADR